MSLSLDNTDLYKILDKRTFYKKREILFNYLKETSRRFILYCDECDNNYGTQKYINPVLWQMGHVVFFYINLVIDKLPLFEKQNLFKHITSYINFYDSFITPIENRKGKHLIGYKEIKKIYTEVVEVLLLFLENNKINFDKKDSYLIMLGVLHNEMHNEAFIFTKLSISGNIPFDTSIIYMDNLIESIDFIEYEGGIFFQGSDDSEHYLHFDNEKPKFLKKINPFSISKYQITEYMFLQFVLSGGYTNANYWCSNGYIWLNKNKITMPLYWKKTSCGLYHKILNGRPQDIKTNLPIMNISYYEAKAYCKWKGVRMPTESEYEYVSTNKGSTNFPWGNTTPDETRCNINYKKFIVPVNYYKSGNNNNGVCQLIGNTWEWCDEHIYPYDGFKIDPVYREMSYPFFGFKKICKGGVFCSPTFMVHPKYRNAQYPDCRIQFIGFRVCL